MATLAQLRSQNAKLRKQNALKQERMDLKRERRRLRYGRVVSYGKEVGKTTWRGAKAVDRFLVPGAYPQRKKKKRFLDLRKL